MVDNGHLFIAFGNLANIACDARLASCDSRFKLNQRWLPTDLTGVYGTEKYANISLIDTNSKFVKKVKDYPKNIASIYLVCVAQSSFDELLIAVDDFFKLAISELDTVPKYNRAKHLITIPLLGTGTGQTSTFSRGGIIKLLLPKLLDYCKIWKIDIAIVTNQQSTFYALQVERMNLIPWSLYLEDRLLQQAEKLATYTKNKQLVLFMGAGVSAGAGLPTWKKLLDDLYEEVTNNKVSEEWHQLNFLDQAKIIEKKLGGSNKLNVKVAKKLQVPCYSITHALLASLPMTEIVTTNYDRLYEAVCMDTTKAIAVLPYDTTENCNRWILKLHGDINHPEDIVLTREDYLRYQDRREALTGIVQALLLTKHMLFVGFSLQDDNFHKIMDAVVKALNPSSTKPKEKKFGTALHLFTNNFTEELWQRDINLIHMADSKTLSIAQAARKQEIFLDFLNAKTCVTTSNMLDEQFSELLDTEQQNLKQYINQFLKNVPENMAKSQSWKLVEKVIYDNFGYPSQTK